MDKELARLLASMGVPCDGCWCFAAPRPRSRPRAPDRQPLDPLARPTAGCLLAGDPGGSQGVARNAPCDEHEAAPRKLRFDQDGWQAHRSSVFTSSPRQERGKRDGSKDRAERQRRAPGGAHPDGESAVPDGARLYVSALTEGNVEVIDTAAGEVVGSFAAGEFPHDNKMSPDGERVYNSSIGNVLTPRETRDSRPEAAGAVCVAARASNYAALVSRETLEPESIVPVGASPGLAPNSPDGQYCFISSERPGPSRRSPTGRATTARITVGEHPKHLVGARVPEVALCGARDC